MQVVYDVFGNQKFGEGDCVSPGPLLLKAARTMKLIAFLLLVTCMQVYAMGNNAGIGSVEVKKKCVAEHMVDGLVKEMGICVVVNVEGRFSLVNVKEVIETLDESGVGAYGAVLKYLCVWREEEGVGIIDWRETGESELLSSRNEKLVKINFSTKIKCKWNKVVGYLSLSKIGKSYEVEKLMLGNAGANWLNPSLYSFDIWDTGYTNWQKELRGNTYSYNDVISLKLFRSSRFKYIIPQKLE